MPCLGRAVTRSGIASHYPGLHTACLPPPGTPRPGKVLRSAVFWAHVGQQKPPCRSLDNYEQRRFCLLLPPWSSSLPSLLSGGPVLSTLPVPPGRFLLHATTQGAFLGLESESSFLFTPKLALRSRLSPVVPNATKLWETTHFAGSWNSGNSHPAAFLGPRPFPPQLPCGAPAPQVSLKSSPESLRVTLSRSTHPCPLRPRDLGLCQYSNWQVSRGRRQKVLGLALNIVHHVKAPEHLCQRRRKRRCCRHGACCCQHRPE